MELEDASALGRFHGMSDIHSIDEADEGDAERDASCQRTKDVAKEGHSLRRVQLRRPDLFLPAPNVDRRAARSAQVAHPVDLAPRRPDEPPAGCLDDRDGRGARLAALPAADRDEPVEAQWNAGRQEELQDRAE